MAVALERRTATMKAIVANRYGPPEKLTLKEIDKPVVDADRALLRVRAASINPVDYHSSHGGLIIRLTSGFRRPKQPVLGTDVAGVIEAVGENVTHLRPGDEVFGGCPGTLAEFALGGKNFVPKPANLTFEQAAAIPIAGLTALQGLRDKGQLQPGQTVLINGASGGVGTFAVQIAKALGGIVTGVTSSRNIELVRSLGADQVIDYTKENFVRLGQRYDLVFDVVGNHSLRDLRRVTKPNGTLVLSGGGHHNGHGFRVAGPMVLLGKGLLLNKFVSQSIRFYIAQFKRDDLLTLKELVEAGKLTPVVDRTYPLEQVPEALRYLQTGHARAKIVITI